MKAPLSLAKIALMAATAVAAVTLLIYELVLVARLAAGGPGHIGSDVIRYAYVLAFLSACGATLILGASAYRRVNKLRFLVAVLASIATLLWLVLHLGGAVFSHESMFASKFSASNSNTAAGSHLRPNNSFKPKPLRGSA